MPNPVEERFAKELIRQGWVDEDSLETARGLHQAQPQLAFATILVQAGLVERHAVWQLYAKTAGLEYVDLEARAPDPEALAAVPSDLCQQHRLLPVAIDEGSLTLAIADPLAYIGLEPVLARRLDRALHFVLAAEDLLENHLLASFDVAPATNQQDPADASERSTQLMENLLAQAIRLRASDLHFDVDEDFVRVRSRIDGKLRDICSLPAAIASGLVRRFKIASRLDISESRRPQDGSFVFGRDAGRVDIRLSTVPTVHGERAVLRLLHRRGVPTRLRDCGFSNDLLAGLRSCLEMPHGMTLVTGPTGSGKTTTLYAALSHIARPDLCVLTIEDPVEYRVAQVSQSQVHRKIGYDFGAALQSFLRQDPDVLLVGEIRNAETAAIAARAALTGHKVLSTLHMTSASEAVVRLYDMGVEPFLLCASLRAVLAQRLVSRICSECREEVEPDPALLARAGVEELRSFRGMGCATCNHTGIRGRTAIGELMLVDEGLRDAIGRNAPKAEIHRLARAAGMRTLWEDALGRVEQGVVSLEEALSAAAEFRAEASLSE